MRKPSATHSTCAFRHRGGTERDDLRAELSAAGGREENRSKDEDVGKPLSRFGGNRPEPDVKDSRSGERTSKSVGVGGVDNQPCRIHTSSHFFEDGGMIGSQSSKNSGQRIARRCGLHGLGSIARDRREGGDWLWRRVWASNSNRRNSQSCATLHNEHPQSVRKWSGAVVPQSASPCQERLSNNPRSDHRHIYTNFALVRRMRGIWRVLALANYRKNHCNPTHHHHHLAGQDFPPLRRPLRAAPSSPAHRA